MTQHTPAPQSFTLFIRPEELKAVSLAMSNEETRYSLCGVYLEAIRAKDGTLQGGIVATNGRQLYAINIKHKMEDGDTVAAGVILPADGVAALDKLTGVARKMVGSQRNVLQPMLILAISCDNTTRAIDARLLIVAGDAPESGACVAGDMMEACATYGGIAKEYAAHKAIGIDGTFPDFRRVMVESNVTPAPAASPFGLDANYLADYAKVAKILVKGSMPHLSIDASNGAQSPVIILLPSYPTFYSVTMPCRL